MKKIGKSKSSQRAKKKAARIIIGLAGFEKISAIEGLHLTRDMKATFKEFERQKASPRERRTAIIGKYGTAS